jgi:hypothetical protein
MVILVKDILNSQVTCFQSGDEKKKSQVTVVLMLFQQQYDCFGGQGTQNIHFLCLNIGHRSRPQGKLRVVQAASPHSLWVHLHQELVCITSVLITV